MVPMRARYGKIDRLVDDLLKRECVTTPPVDVHAIARQCGAQVHHEDFQGDVSGVLVRRNGEVFIGVAKFHSRVRQRFTVAHELGHMLLHEGEQLHVDKSFSVNWRKDRQSETHAKDIVEIEANAFAAALLMPKSLLEEAAGSTYFDLEDQVEIERLARLFDVSMPAMSFRLLNLFGRNSV